MTMRPPALGLLSLIICSAGLAAQSGDVQGRVWGPNGRPVRARVVTLVRTAFVDTSDVLGRYRLTNVPANTYLFHVVAPGYPAVQVRDVVVVAGNTTTVDVGVGPRQAYWAHFEDSLRVGTGPSRRIILFADSLGVVPTPGDSAHRRRILDSLAARGLRVVTDGGGVMVFTISAAPGWHVLAARDSVFRLAHALRRDLPDLVKQAGPLVRFRSGGVASVATDEVVVRFDPALSMTQINAINTQVGARVVYRNPFVQNEFLVQASDHDGIALSNGYWSVIGPPRVASAYPNFRVRSSRTAAPAGDPLSGDQWHLKRINVEPAWARTTGNAVVAVIEQDGFEDTHPDLKDRLWHSADVGGLDVDGDGLAGATSGWNFTECSTTANSEDANPRPGLPRVCGAPDVSPATAVPVHGTAVAGLVAADQNGEGVVGVCPGCRLMTIVVDSTDPNSQKLGFLFAEFHKAQVINLSWRLGTHLGELDPDYVAVVTRIAGKRPVVAAIGNEDQDFCTGENAGFQAIPEVVVVGASNQRDKRIRSGRGACLSLLAPAGKGNDLLGVTTTDVSGRRGRNSEATDRCRLAVAEFSKARVPTREYTRCFGGTSAAAPIVSGVVGLMLSVNPALTGPQIDSILGETADKIDAHAANYDDAMGKSVTHGYGRLNACAAVLRVVGDANWRECVVLSRWFCRWWAFLLVALVFAVVVFVVLSLLTGAVYPQAAPPKSWLWVRLALSALAGTVAFLLLWLFCRQLILWFCLVAGITVGVIVFLIWRTLPVIWRIVVSLLAGAVTFGVLRLLLRHLT